MSQRDFHKPRPLCPLCGKRSVEIRGYSKGGEPSYRSRCAKCRGVVRAVHGLPARRGKEGRPGVPRCPGCLHVLVKFCPHCGRPLGKSVSKPRVSEGRAAVASGSGTPGGSAAGGGAADGEDRKLIVLREVGERRGRVSFVEFLAIAERLQYDQAGAEALLVAHPQRGPDQGPERKSYLRRVKDDVELTRDGYDLLTSIGLRPPYFLLREVRSGLPQRGPQRNG